jgi:hypothetical protein
MKSVPQEIVGRPWIHLITAGKKIDGGITVFRPGMDGQVGFRDHDNSTDAMGRKHPENSIDYRRPGSDSSLFHITFNKVQVVQHRRITIVKFNKYVPA